MTRATSTFAAATAHGLTFLANYTWAKNLSDAPDFRSPMFESSIPQNNNDLAAENGSSLRRPASLRRSARSTTIPAWDRSGVLTGDQQGLAHFYRLPGPDRIPVHHFRLRRHGELGHGAGRESDSRQPYGTANLSIGHTHRNELVQHGLHLPRLRRTRSATWAATRCMVRECRRWIWRWSRDFNLTERAKFQFRGEFFNALNHTNLGTPDRFVNTPQFGTITEATTPGRQIQLSARLSF